jgi:vWA domain found in the FtsH ternary systems/N-terminal helical region fused to the FtsH ternary system vWA domain
MSLIEIRDLDAARAFLGQGLWLHRVVAPSAATVRPALEQALEIVAGGHSLPPVGFIGDLCTIVFEIGRESAGRPGRDLGSVSGLPAGLVRRYEDLVLGKFYTDWTFDRAADVLRHLAGRDRRRGLAFVVGQFQERSGADGVVLSPAVIKTLLEAPPEEVLGRAWDQLTRDGVSPLLVKLYQSLIDAARRVAEVLAPEDVFELEHGTALAELGQRVALRQVLQMARRFEDNLPARRARGAGGPREVPTRVLDEDTYPVGGYASLANRGSMESLLHSQLAFMEPAGATGRPDLFDVKFLRDELLYYSRDENQFLRRRQTFVVVLAPDLVSARFKDVDLPAQRIVMVLGLLVAAVRRLTEWLNEDSLTFEFLFPGAAGNKRLTHERELLGMIFREAQANGTVRLETVADVAAAAKLCRDRSRRSLCHVLSVGVAPPAIEADDCAVAQLTIFASSPSLASEGGSLEVEVDEALAAWDAVLSGLLRLWV